MSFNREESRKRIREANAALMGKVDVTDFVRDLDLESVSREQAYRVDGVHVYVDILNVPSLVDTGKTESETAHRRFLRFLHVYQRIVHLVLQAAGAKKIDFQNQRLHFVVYKPLNDETSRIKRAVAVADLIRQVIRSCNELHAELPDVRLAIGIESGIALAVNNGTRGDREPLFLGAPANQAAKLLSSSEGIFLGASARRRLGAGYVIADPKAAPLPETQVAAFVRDETPPAVSRDGLIRQWATEVQNNPMAEFQFSRPSLPLRGLDLEELSPANSRRLEAVSLFADVDGFTKFVDNCMASGNAALAVRTLHVIRKELRDIVSDFDGRKIRYHGDCLQGVLAEGTSRETDAAGTIGKAVLCAAALRDAFGLIQQEIPEAASLGLAIGIDYGPTTITRLGVRGDRSRCTVGIAAAAAQRAQQSGTGAETVIGLEAFRLGSDAVRDLFKTGRRVKGLGFADAVAQLKASGDDVAKYVRLPAAAVGSIPGRAYSS